LVGAPKDLGGELRTPFQTVLVPTGDHGRVWHRNPFPGEQHHAGADMRDATQKKASLLPLGRVLDMPANIPKPFRTQPQFD
jgi:hypothetical protein